MSIFNFYTKAFLTILIGFSFQTALSKGHTDSSGYRASTQTPSAKNQKFLINAYKLGGQCDFSKRDLRKAQLAKKHLRGAYLLKANLSGADLRGTSLTGADLQGANLQGTNLQGASLIRANLFKADLRGANLQGALLNGANLHKAKYNAQTKFPQDFNPDKQGMAQVQ